MLFPVPINQTYMFRGKRNSGENRTSERTNSGCGEAQSRVWLGQLQSLVSVTESRRLGRFRGHGKVGGEGPVPGAGLRSPSGAVPPLIEKTKVAPHTWART